jgi:methyl-CpG-binding domain protein 4
MKKSSPGTVLRDDLMVQEQIDGSWQHMVGVIMLNQTDRIQVKRVLPAFLKKWPTAKRFLKSNPKDVIEVIRSLGFYNRRENALRKMSEQYLTWDGNDATMLYGIGKYGSDSYEIFFKQNYSVQPTDKELKRYLKERGIDVFETA